MSTKFLGGMRGLTKFVEKIRNCANQVRWRVLCSLLSFFLSFFLSFSLETPTGELDLVEDPSASFLLSLSLRERVRRARSFVRSFVRSSVGVVLYPHLSVHR